MDCNARRSNWFPVVDSQAQFQVQTEKPTVINVSVSTFFTDRYTQSVKTTVRLYFTFLEVDKAVRSEGRPPLMATRQSSLLDYFTVDVVLLLLLPLYTFTLNTWARSQGTFEVGTSWGCQTKHNKRTEYRIRVF